MSVCAQCQNNFTIYPEDRQFYQKFDVPDPILCPACRNQRRLAHRNEFMLYADQCDLCKQPIISQFSPDKQLTVYCKTCWWGDGWDSYRFGRDFDFSKPFFKQFSQLVRDVPQMNLIDMRSENSDYTNCVSNNKNCYLIFNSDYNENCLYSNFIEFCRETVDCLKQTNVFLENGFMPAST